jgi:PST family polysaccharide transporter
MTSISIRNGFGKNFKSILLNSGWLVFDKIFRLTLGLLVGVLTARYLGPERLGLLNYAIAFVSFFAVIANLGLDSIIVRDISDHKNGVNVTLGTACLLRLVTSAISFVFACGAIYFYRPGNALLFYLVALFSFTVFFQAFDVIDYFYQARLRSRIPVWIKCIAFLVSGLIKLLLIYYGAPLIAFAWASLFEFFMICIGMILAYHLLEFKISFWRFDFSLAKRMILEGWPLLFSGVLVTIYLRVDQIMIGNMLGDKELGIYSVAVRLTEIWSFIPMAITASVLPLVVNAKNNNTARYYQILEHLYLLMLWLSLSIALILTFSSGIIINILFGPEYSDAKNVVIIQCWSGVFIFAGLVSNHWYLLEGKNKLTFYRQVTGVLMNVVLNLVLIPRLGISGAAWATLITQIFISYFFDLINKSTRPIFFIRSKIYLLFIPITYNLVFKKYKSR